MLGRLGQILMHLLSAEIPKEVVFGNGVTLMHNCVGTVMHTKVQLGDRCTIYHNVTLGRKNPLGPFGGIVIEDDAIVCAGAKVLGGEEPLIVGKGSIVGANAVLTHSIPPYEVWGGIPARKIKDVEIEQREVL